MPASGKIPLSDIENINIEGVDLTDIERRLDLLEENQISSITINP
jgi:hypothetical protein